MKLITLFALTSLISTSVYSQQLINQKDPFSGKQVKVATITLGGAIKNIGQMVSFAESDGKKYVSLTWMPSMSGVNVQGIDFDNFDIKRCSILLLMENDSLMKFKADSTLSRKSGSGKSALLAIGALISDEQLKYLSTYYVKIIRLGLTDENIGVDLPFVNDKIRKQIQKASSFMLVSK